MSAFSMQVACGCGLNGPIGMDQLALWDGEHSPAGFVAGRRYIWQCPRCNNQICVNMTLLDDDPHSATLAQG